MCWSFKERSFLLRSSSSEIQSDMLFYNETVTIHSHQNVEAEEKLDRWGAWAAQLKLR